MEKLVGNDLKRESWDEYADHSLTHDNVVVVEESRFPSDAWWHPLPAAS